MGYTTTFSGFFSFNKTLDSETHDFLTRLNQTRRMKRDVDPKYGIQGEFYVYGSGFAGQEREDNIIDYNTPPNSQPSLWCGWVPSETGDILEWDGQEKFYCYVEWLEYIIQKILIPKGYTLNGTVEWNGEDFEDRGTITVEDNQVAALDQDEYIDQLERGLKEMIKASPNAAYTSPNPTVRAMASKLKDHK